MKILIALMVCFSLNTFAGEYEKMEKKWDSMSFEDAKKMKLEMLDKKAAKMAEDRKCFSDAKDKDGLKACKEKMKAERKEMKEKMKEKKKK